MAAIDTENKIDSPALSDEYIESQIVKDRENVDNALNGQTKTFDYYAFKRLVLNELQYSHCFKDAKFCVYTRKRIVYMAEHPERFGKKILELSDYMYLKSGYYKRLIDYFSNQAMINYTVDTQINDVNAYSVGDKIKKNYISFVKQAEKFNLKNEVQNIFRRLYRNDVCYAYMVETDIDISYFYLDPQMCHIDRVTNGNVFQFYIDTTFFGTHSFNTFYKSLPRDLQELINNNPPENNGKVFIPREKSLCLKYNSDFLFPFPPFFMMIMDILLIDDYKELAKAQSINDAYKILTMKIPTKDGQITLDDKLITTFTSIVLNTLQNNIGVVTTPFDMATEEFSSSNADDRDTVSDAISWAFKNVGVSEALMSGASSGSELKLSITNDSGDIFRLYRQIESWMSLQMKLRGYIYKSYGFVYKILDMTIFNEKDVRDGVLSAAQNGIPNKTRLCAANGLSPAVMLGNSLVENDILADVFDGFKPLKTSYTQGAENDEGGRPEMDEADLSSSGERTKENDTNDRDNRI